VQPPTPDAHHVSFVLRLECAVHQFVQLLHHAVDVGRAVGCPDGFVRVGCDLHAQGERDVSAHVVAFVLGHHQHAQHVLQTLDLPVALAHGQGLAGAGEAVEVFSQEGRLWLAEAHEQQTVQVHAVALVAFELAVDLHRLDGTQRPHPLVARHRMLVVLDDLEAVDGRAGGGSPQRWLEIGGRVQPLEDGYQPTRQLDHHMLDGARDPASLCCPNSSVASLPATCSSCPPTARSSAAGWPTSPSCF